MSKLKTAAAIAAACALWCCIGAVWLVTYPFAVIHHAADDLLDQ